MAFLAFPLNLGLWPLLDSKEELLHFHQEEMKIFWSQNYPSPSFPNPAKFRNNIICHKINYKWVVKVNHEFACQCAIFAKNTGRVINRIELQYIRVLWRRMFTVIKNVEWACVNKCDHVAWNKKYEKIWGYFYFLLRKCRGRK